MSEGSEIMQCRVTIATNCTALYVPGHEPAVYKEWLSLESVRNKYDINTSGLQLTSTSRCVVNRIPRNLTSAIPIARTLDTVLSFFSDSS